MTIGTGSQGRRIAFFLRRPTSGSACLESSLTRDVVTHLRTRGARVDLLVPEDAPVDLADLRRRYDLYVLKSKSPLALSLAAALEAAGAAVVNTPRATALAHDKIASTALLAAAGVPVPPSWATGRAALVRPLLNEGPVWLKPPGGSRGDGVRRVTDRADLADLDDGACVDPYGLPLPLFAQREVPSRGRDLKVYVIGSQTWAITRCFPARTLADKLGTPAELSEPIRRAALQSGRALGLEIYGADFLLGPSTFHAVDVNAFPGYKGIPEAASALASYLEARACTGQPTAVGA